MKLPGLMTMAEAAEACGIDKRTLRKRIGVVDAQLRAAGEPGCITRFGGKTSALFVSRKALKDSGLMPIDVQEPDDRVGEIAADVKAIREQLEWIGQSVTAAIALRD